MSAHGVTVRIIAEVLNADDFPCLDEADGVVERVDTEARANARLIAAAPRMHSRIATLADAGDTEAISILKEIHGHT